MSSRDNRILFTVLLCVHDDNPFLDAAIKSVLNQSFQDFEFIIVSNNCTDELYTKLLSYNDERIRLFRTKIGQLCFNLNFGLNLARGEYIVRMDSDDICYSDRIYHCIKYIDSGVDVVAYSADYIDETGNIIGEAISGGSILLKNPIIHPACIIKRESLLGIRGYSGGFQSEDYDLWIRMFKSNFTFKFEKNKVLGYRIRDGQTKGNTLPYCEVSSYFMREFLLSLNLKYLLGFVVSFIKRFLK